MKLFILLFFPLLSLQTFAKKIQILHTNDLHSYFEGTRGGVGGYAQLKFVANQLRKSAQMENIPTLFLDAGDFGEGSSYHFSSNGVDSLRALDQLGIDATVLGNHDYILGGRELAKQIQEAQLKAKILSANLVGKTRMGLTPFMPDYHDFNISGFKVRIIGLSTNEIHFMYPMRPLGYINDYLKTGIKQDIRAKNDQVDFAIALTHLGVAADARLIKNTTSIHLVVGGHDHAILPKPRYVQNKNGKLIPLVQAGAHAGYLGSLIIDLKGEGNYEIVSYELHPIRKFMSQDLEVQDFVSQAYKRRERYFNRSWDEVIGISEIPLSGNINGQNIQNRTCWSDHVAKLTQDVAQADLGIQVDNFNGEQVSAGEITFGDIIDNFPHLRTWGDKGWKISRAMIPGVFIKKFVEVLTKSEISSNFTVAGLQAMDPKTGILVPYDSKKHGINDIYIRGEKIKVFKNYSVGMPSEIPFALNKMFGLLSRLLFTNVTTIRGSEYWGLFEAYIKGHSPLKCLSKEYVAGLPERI